MPDVIDVINGLEESVAFFRDRLTGDMFDKWLSASIDALALLKSQEPRVMTLDLPPAEWEDKVIWLEIKGKKPIPCLFRKCCDRMMFGRYERIMSFDAIGSSKEGGYFLRNYGVTWRCWTSRPTDEQREVTPW